jgi:hypothetical protein
MHTNRGVIYICTGKKFYGECLRSVASLKKHNPGLSVTIYSERHDVDSIFDNSVVLKQPRFSMVDKVCNIWKTPYNETLYIDTDTLITASLDEYFDVLEYCDFAGTIESARGWWYEGKMDIPRGLCDINGGVLCFKNTPAVMGALRQWYTEYQKTSVWLKEYGPGHWYLTNDQPSLRKLIWTNRDIRVAILPDEYNALRLFGTRLWGEAKIVHGRGDIGRIAAEMNADAGKNRVFLQGAGTVKPIQSISAWNGLKQCFRMFLSIIYLKLKPWENPVLRFITKKGRQ